MGLFGTIDDIAKQISKTTPFDFDGISKAMRYNANDVAKSFAIREGVKQGTELRAMKSTLKGMKDTGSTAYKELSEEISKKQKIFDEIVTAKKTGTAEAVNEAMKDVTGKDKIGIMATAQGYFGDATYGGTRKKVAATAVVGGAIGARYLSGGNMTTNAQGERDIAGIPFI